MKLTVGKGLDDYLATLGNLLYNAPKTVGEATYEGAKIVADEIKKNIEALPTDESWESEHTSGKLKGMKKIQKIGLLNSLGISGHRVDNGYYNVKIGFDGYNLLGQPNAMIARTFEGGNSFTKKTPFVAPAVRATRERAEQKMKETVDKIIQNTMN